MTEATAPEFALAIQDPKAPPDNSALIKAVRDKHHCAYSDALECAKQLEIADKLIKRMREALTAAGLTERPAK